MDPDNRSPKDNKPPRPGAPGGGDPNFNWRSLIIIAIAFGLIAAYWIVRNSPNANSEEVHYDDFIKYLDSDKIYKDDTHPLELLIEEGSSTQTLSGYYSKLVPAHADSSKQFHTTVLLDFNKDLEKRLADKGLQLTQIRNRSNVVVNTLLSFAPILLFLLILYWLFRQQIRMAGKGAMNFGKSKARMMARDKNKITFKDVAGVDEAKDEVQELVEFLKDPKKFQKLGGRIPKGVLMIGSPGTGKNAAGSRHRRRGRRAVFHDQRFGFRGDVRRRRCQPRA